MKLEIVSVKGAGILKEERVVLRANADTDIGDYLVADTTYQGEGQVSNKLRNIFWLPDKIVSARDLVVIYSKSGNDKTQENKSGTRTHFIYWDLNKTVWNKDEDAITLFHIKDWDVKQVKT
ncbi:hypothetical protein J2X32_001124 [Rheinheimera pacifica]|uniref:hypothetical protein n=1 Tax=Rheinheimera pacifica TaxID=173990 RepID=UPI0028588008|nr:hypothetical protein [Rheinheimera pacifica]MDR6982506.1 hypothetical protein [Rheinheimera pacifica]